MLSLRFAEEIDQTAKEMLQYLAVLKSQKFKLQSDVLKFTEMIDYIKSQLSPSSSMPSEFDLLRGTVFLLKRQLVSLNERIASAIKRFDTFITIQETEEFSDSSTDDEDEQFDDYVSDDDIM